MNTEPDSEADSDYEVKHKRCFCRVHDKKRIRWDLFIMLFAIWNCIQIPYSIAFNQNSEQSPMFTAFNLFVDSFFIADLLINFRTSYLNEDTGEEIYQNNNIFWQYVKGKLIEPLYPYRPVLDRFGIISSH